MTSLGFVVENVAILNKCFSQQSKCQITILLNLNMDLYFLYTIGPRTRNVRYTKQLKLHFTYRTTPIPETHTPDFFRV